MMPYKMALYPGENLAIPQVGDVFVVTEIAEDALEFRTGKLVLVKAVVTLDAIGEAVRPEREGKNENG